MAVICSKVSLMNHHFFIPRPFRIYPNLDIWFENIPSGNPGGQHFHCRCRCRCCCCIVTSNYGFHSEIIWIEESLLESSTFCLGSSTFDQARDLRPALLWLIYGSLSWFLRVQSFFISVPFFRPNVEIILSADDWFTRDGDAARHRRGEMCM
jgi:hypothetical protein